MDYEELKEHVMDFFGDTSRSAAETRDGLEQLAEEARMLAESIDVGADAD